MSPAFFKGLALSAMALTALASLSPAQASVVSATRGASSGYELIGDAKGSLSFSESLREALSTTLLGTPSTVSPVGATTYIAEDGQGSDDFSPYSGVGGLTLQSLTFDSHSGQVIDEQYSGGFTISLPFKRNLTSQASSMTVSNLRIDLSQNTVYASVSGGKIEGRLDNVPMWTFTDVQGRTNALNAMMVRIDDGLEIIHYPTTLINTNGIGFNLGGLYLTDQGNQAWNLGLSADHGLYGGEVMTSVVGASSFSSYAPPVPESGTHAMTLLGLAGIGLAHMKMRSRK